MMKYTIRYVGICGSDILRLDMGQSPEMLGHEVVAQNEHGWYALNPLVVCGECEFCQSGATRFCSNLASMGKDGKGGLSGGTITLPVSNAVAIQPNHPAAFVLADPLACVLHGLSLLNNPTKDVLVIGDGTIAELLCRMLEKRNIPVCQVVKRRRITTVPSERIVITSGDVAADRYETAVVCVGGENPAVINQAIHALRASGQLLVMGAFHSLAAGLDTKALLTKEIQLVGSYSYEPADFQAAVNEITVDESMYASFISDIYPSDQLNDAIEHHRVSQTRLKVVVAF